MMVVVICAVNAFVVLVLLKSFFASDKTRKILRMVDPTVPSKEFENKMKESETDLGFLLQLASGDNLRDKHPCFNLRRRAQNFQSFFHSNYVSFEKKIIFYF